MTEQIGILLPAVEFTGNTTHVGTGWAQAHGQAGFKRLWRLEWSHRAALGPFPDEVKITRLWLWNQYGDVYPAAGSGDMSVAVDPGGHYTRISGIPEDERVQPFNLKTLGILEFLPGHKHGEKFDHSPPIAYRKGDLIVLAPEANGIPGVTFQIFSLFMVEAMGDWPILPGIVFDLPRPDGSASGTYCIRSLAPAIPMGGGQIRAHVSALDNGCALSHLGVGKQVGAGANMAAAPVPLTFGGAAALSLGARGEAWSDWVPFNTMAGDNLLFNIETAGAYAFLGRPPPPGGTAPISKSPYPSWFSTTPSHASAPMLGAIGDVPARTYCIDAVQVAP